jgi:hypothetical protein
MNCRKKKTGLGCQPTLLVSPNNLYRCACTCGVYMTPNVNSKEIVTTLYIRVHNNMGLGPADYTPGLKEACERAKIWLKTGV